MPRILFLGTSAAVASKERDNSSILLSEGKEKILIDTPGCLLVKLARLNIDYREINNIFLTHSHPDHTYGLVSLLHSRYKLHDCIRIFAHQETVNLVKSLRRIFRLESADKYPKIIYNTVRSSLSRPFYDSEYISAYAFKVRHSNSSLGLKFLFKRNKTTLVYCSDTARSDELIDVARDCTCLIHDCFAPARFFKRYPQLNRMHTSSAALGEIAEQVRPRLLIPIHLSSEVRYSIDVILKEIRRSFSGRILLPRDLETIRLN